MSLFLVLILLVLSPSFFVECSTVVELYKEPYFGGAMHEIISSANCTDLPADLKNFNGSIKTGGCIALFESSKCYSRGFVIRHEERRLSELESKYLHDKRQNYNVNSIRDCNELETGPGVNIDVYWSRYSTDYSGEETKYRNNTCSCITLPDSYGYDVDVNLHGNCFKVYENEDCTGEPFTRVHGIHGNVPDNVRSVERCDQPIHCYSKLNASVFAIEINNNTSNLLGVVRDRETSLRKTFTNNGSAAIERHYNATEGVWEITRFQFSDALNPVNFISLEGEPEKTLRFSIPFVSQASEELRRDLEKDSGKETKLRYQTSIEKQFRIHKKLVVPQCTKFKVNSVIEMVENIEINYKVLLTITGTNPNSAQQLTRSEIKESFEKYDETQIKFLDDHEQANDFTVVAETTAKLSLNYGRNAVVSATGIPILDCHVRHKQCSFECKR